MAENSYNLAMRNSHTLAKCTNSEATAASITSPIRTVSSKHSVTPMKTRSKMSKCEEDKDVHTALSPVTSSSRLSKLKNTSPVAPGFATMCYVGVCSQELPDVIWDYNSPRSKNSQRLNSLTINDLLKNIRHSNQENDEAQSTKSVQLLEKWNMFHTKSPAASKAPYRCHPRIHKKPPRLILEEMKKFIKPIDEPEDDVSKNDASNGRIPIAEEQSCNNDKIDPAAHREFKREETVSSLDGESIDLDSDDELWGVDGGNDDEVIVSATHDFGACLISHAQFPTQSTHVIPETCGKTTQYLTSSCHGTKVTSNIYPLLTASTQVIGSKLSQLSSVHLREPTQQENEDPCVSDITEWNWDSDCDETDWSNDLSVIDTLSQVPDDVLKGQTESDVSGNLLNKTVVLHSSNDELCNAVSKNIVGERTLQSRNNSEKSRAENQSCDRKANVSVMKDENNMSCSQLLLDMDSDVFNDESLFDETCEITIASLESRPRCTPVEIALKKKEALKKLKAHQRNRH